MTITAADVTEPTFARLSEAEQDAYLAAGQARFDSLCLEYRIDSTLIATPAPYVPKTIAVTCVLIEMLTDFVGSDWREISAGVTIDVYQAKLTVLQARLRDLLGSFTPATCGYADDSVSDPSTGSFCIPIGRG